MRVVPLEAPLGARIEGINLRQEINEKEVAGLRDAFLRYDGFLVIPGQDISPADQARFGRNFGPLIVHPLFEFNHPETSEVFVLSNEKVGDKKMGLDDGGSNWHSDYSYKKVPALSTILYGVKIPNEGGDTLILNMYKAYETLDTPTKNQIENLKANNWLKIGGHDHARDFRPPGVKPAASVITAKIDPKFIADNPPTVHPVVRVHPETGRKCLYVHPATTHSIVGYSEDESRKLLYHLFAHMTKPEHYVRHKWTKGDVVMWDNRCTMHAATTSGMPSTNHRTVYRVTVDAPVF